MPPQVNAVTSFKPAGAFLHRRVFNRLDERVTAAAEPIHLHRFLGFAFLAAALSVPLVAAAQSVTVSAGGTPSAFKQINVPPGVAGMTPKLGLLYSASGVNGPVSYGWGLQGISVITRCSATQATDGAVQGVAFTVNDKLCLDGQRLIQVKAGTSTVVNDAFPAVGSGSSFQSGDAAGQAGTNFIEFRTEKDIYSRIRAYGALNGDTNGVGGPTYFRVWTKSGQIYQYGGDPALPNGNNALVTQTSGVAPVNVAWPVARISDTLGNSVDFKYTQITHGWGSALNSTTSTSGIEWNLAEVAYSGNKVIFNYTTRASSSPQDSSEAYQMGFKTVSTQLLQSVVSYVNSPNPASLGAASGAVKVSQINLTYGQSNAENDTTFNTGRSVLKRIQECAGPSAAQCLPATTYTYATGDRDIYTPNSKFLSSPLATLPLQNSAGSVGALTGDFNGDGLTDVFVWADDPTKNALYTSNGDGTFNQLSTIKQNLFRSDGCFTSQLGDFNGDGLPDILIYEASTSIVGSTCPATTPNAALYVNTGGGNFIAYQVTLQPLTGAPITTLNLAPSTISATACKQANLCQVTYTPGSNFYLLDVNGDGKLDIVTSYYPGAVVSETSTVNTWVTNPCPAGGCTRVFLGNGAGTFTEVASNLNQKIVFTSPSTKYIPGAPASVADINGDGLNDLLSMFNGSYSATQPSSTTWISNGNGNFTASTSSAPCAYPIDFNGDGRMDCLGPGSGLAGANTNLLWAGVGVVGSNFTGNQVSNFNLAAANYVLSGTAGVAIADFNGDGRQDILNWQVTPSQTSPNVLYISNGDGTFKPSPTFNLGTFALGNPQTKGQSFLIGDFTGHGTAEVLIMSTAASTASPNALYTKSDFTPPDQLISVTTGTGATTSLNYVSLNNSTPTNSVSQALGPRYVSDRGTSQAAAYPTLDLNYPLYVVATSVTDSGVGALGVQPIVTEYAYKGLKADMTGRGFLGFRENLTQTAAPDGSALTVDSQSIQTYPYIGVAQWSKTFHGTLNTTASAPLLSQTVNQYCDQTNVSAAGKANTCLPASHVALPYLYTTTESGTDLSGTALPTVVSQNTYDGAGDPLSTTVTTTGSAAGLAETFTKTTSNTYFADNTNCTDYQTCFWVRGRLAQSTVTNTVPANVLASIATSAGSSSNASATSGSGTLLTAALTPSLSFTAVPVGGSPVQLTATLENDGAQALSVTVPGASSVTGPGFSFVSTTCQASLAVNSSCAIVVQFLPSAEGVNSGTLSVATSARTLSSALSGTGLQAEIAFSPTSLAWGNQQVNASYGSSAVTLTNKGNIAATSLALAVPTGFALAGNTCGSSLSNGSSCSFTVTWSPNAVQTYTGSITATSSGVASNALSLSGNALAPSATLSGASFAALQTGQSSSQSVVLSNTGVGPLTLSAPGSGSVSGAGFSYGSTTCGATLAAGASCGVTVTFNPGVAGAANGTVTLSTNAGVLTGALSGSAQVPSATLTGAAFGNVQYETSGSQTATLTNTGIGPIAITAPSSSSMSGANFSYIATNCPASLAAGASCTLNLNFFAASVGSTSGAVSVVTSAGTETGALTATGVAAVLSFSTTSVGFGTQAVNQSYTSGTVTLTNSGNEAASSLGIGATGGFSITNNGCGVSLPTNSSCSFTISWNPTAAQAYSGGVGASSGDGISANGISVSGTAVNPSFTASPTSSSCSSSTLYYCYMTFTINVAYGPATGVSAALTTAVGAGNMTSTTCTGSVQSSCTVTVEGIDTPPLGSGSTSGSGHVSVTSTNGASISVPVSWNVIAPPAAACPANWQLIETQEMGYVPAGLLKPNMHVRGPDGRAWEDVYSSVTTTSRIYRLFVDGEALDVSEDHSVMLADGAWRNVADLQAGDQILGQHEEPVTVRGVMLLGTGQIQDLSVHGHAYQLGHTVGHNKTAAN